MAGDRSSPVLRDDRLETGNQKTIYLFNLLRGEIIEYALEIVEKKLRPLEQGESGYISELDAGYKNARRSFKARGAMERNIVYETATPSRSREAEDYDESSNFSADDSDMLLESDEA